MTAEIQKFQAVLSKHLTSSQKFTDNEFPPDSHKSIGGPYSKYPFRRASEILDHVAIMAQGIDPNEIRQGVLNDTYLLSAIAALAEEPALIERLFLTEEANRAGLYALWMCDNGAWKPVLLDDYLPCRQYSGSYLPAFAQCKTGDLWVGLLEKAYAKLNGCYFNIEAGLPHYALRDLTGAPVEELYDEQDMNKIWEFILNGVDNEHFLLCSTELIEDNEETPEGVAKGYAYSILDAREVATENGQQRLVLVRNPWDTFEWKGAWSKTSDLWTEELRNELNYPEDEHESLFWMNIEDYQKYFPVTWVCKYKKDNKYYSVNFSHKQNNSNVLRLTVKERQEVTISLNQKDRRCFRSDHPDYFYSYARLLLGKVENNGLEYITGNASGFERNLHATAVLEPGTYLLTIEMNWSQNYCRDFNVSFYSEKRLQIESLYEVDLMGIQKNIIKSAIGKVEVNKTLTNYGKYGDPQIQKTVDCIHGIFYFHYDNRSKKKNKLCETIKFSQISNLKICSPFTNDNHFDVTVLPGNDLLVLYKAVLDDYSWGYSASFYINPVTREDERTPPNVYTYIDDPDNRVKTEVNDNYNVYVKGEDEQAEEEEEEKQRQEPAKRDPVGQNKLGKKPTETKAARPEVENYEEDKEYQNDRYYEEDNGRSHHDNDPYYYFPQGNNPKSAQKAKQNDSKKPREYPLTVMQLGQTNSKKVRYTNYDDWEKQLVVVSSRPEIIQVKNPRVDVERGEDADIRLRFHAPNNPGRYMVRIEVRNTKDSSLEEVLQFPIENRE